MNPRQRPDLEPRAKAGGADPDAFVNGWIGTPFKWDGRTREGVDCWGIVWRFYFDCLGISLPDWTVGDRGQAFVDATFAGQMADHWFRFDEPRDFCLVMVPQGRRAAHAGVFWRGGVLHADPVDGVVWQPLARFRATYAHCQFGEYSERSTGGGL